MMITDSLDTEAYLMRRLAEVRMQLCESTARAYVVFWGC